MSTLITGQDPGPSSPDDDPTGVRALLSALPEPDPMPEHLVERINASLAAERAQRARRASEASGTPLTSVTPLLGTTRRRPARLLFAMAGAAAAVTLIAVVGNTLVGSDQSATIAGRASDASSPSAPAASPEVLTSKRSAGAAEAPGQSPAQAPAQAQPGSLGSTEPALIQIRLSDTRYTRAEFVAQARTLGDTTLGPLQQTGARSSPFGWAGTPAGLTSCLKAIGAAGAQTVRADVAFYDGQPAVIIVATTNDLPTAYAVGFQCSPSGATILRPATPLP